MLRILWVFVKGVARRARLQFTVWTQIVLCIVDTERCKQQKCHCGQRRVMLVKHSKQCMRLFLRSD